MYLRFVLTRTHPNSGFRDGVFGAAYELREGDELAGSQRQELESLLRWFDDNLQEPTRFNRTNSKGRYRRATRGLSWFKSSAVKHIQKLRDLISILEDHGFHVTKVKARNPGYIVYEDNHQIVAEPFSDTPA